MPVPTLRPDQEECIQKLRDSFARGNKRVVLRAPTRMGKTVIACFMMARAAEKGLRSLYIANRIELVRQPAEKLEAYGVEHGILRSGVDRTDALIQVASIPTLRSWCERGGMDWPHADLVIADEVHDNSCVAVLQKYDVRTVGLTATPARGDGRGLGEFGFWEDMVDGPTYAYLKEIGQRVPLRIVAPDVPQGVEIIENISDEELLRRGAAVLDTKELVGDVVANWKKHGENRSTVLFACSPQHSRHLVEKFIEEGIPAAHVDNTFETKERRPIYEAHERGEIKVLSNFGILGTGWDAGWVSCVIMNRPVGSYVLWAQLANRGAGKVGDKQDCIVIDHAGNVHKWGMPDADIRWPFKGGNVNEIAKKEVQRKKEKNLDPLVCQKCYTFYERGPKCPNCGHQAPPRVSKIAHVDGELHEVRKRQERRHVTPTDPQQYWQRRWDSLLFWAGNSGRSIKNAMARFFDEGGEFNDLKRLRNFRPEWTAVDREMKVASVFPWTVNRNRKGAKSGS